MKFYKMRKALCLTLIGTMLMMPFGSVTAHAEETVNETVVDAETTEATTEETAVGSETLVNYVVVDQPSLTSGSQQMITVGIGDGTKELTEATLTYQNDTTGVQAEVSMTNQTESAAEFAIDCTESGSYRLVKIAYTLDGVIYEEDFETMGIEAKWGVDTEVETNPDDVTVDEDATDDAITVEEMPDAEDAGEVAIEDSSAETITDALQSSETEQDMEVKSDFKAFKSMVIVLDPGHDATHRGAQCNGYDEATLNLKIAQYCKAELQKYAGVTVYMTRESMACPHPGMTSQQDNAARVEYAKSVGADVYVSIHLNSGSSSAHGAEVYYPNGSYNSAIGAEGAGLAQSVLNNLKALGLKSNGTKIRNSEDNSLYPDGSLADYYGVIKRSKLNGFPGIIIEHAFMSNASDCANYLSSDAKLKALGVADAKGIASYYKLDANSYDAVFQSKYYYRNNPDLQSAIGTDENKLLSHFLTYGLNEGRVASPVFDINYYMNNNADLKAAYGSNRMAYVNHFMTYGMKEGRQASTNFNAKAYKNRYADISANFGDDLTKYYYHYIEYGQYEGRNGTANDNTVVVPSSKGYVNYPTTGDSYSQYMYRLYNPNSGEHFYTASTAEADNVIEAGWRYEGTGWKAPKSSSVPVYRLYNPNAGDHHYTMDANEKDNLVRLGWNYEGIGWYSAGSNAIPLYRQYNPNAKAGSHNYTVNYNENNNLVSLGWRAEGVSWYGL